MFYGWVYVLADILRGIHVNSLGMGGVGHDEDQDQLLTLQQKNVPNFTFTGCLNVYLWCSTVVYILLV